MRQARRIDGRDLEQMFAAATGWLEKCAPDIDALNVFPVPDGDTGTNMLLTMRSSIQEASRVAEPDVPTVIQALAKGALMGARGNSGVILSQIWRGLAKSLGEKDAIDGSDLARALLEASETAYKGLTNPVEGTILTVIREAAAAALGQLSSSDGDLTLVLEATVSAAREALASTPELLPVLKEAEVVDAGGHGLYTLLEGALLYLRGETEQLRSGQPQVIGNRIPLTAKPLIMENTEELPFGFCTEFLLKGENFELDVLRKNLMDKGQSLIVVGDETTVRVHIHTLDPDGVTGFAGSLGSLHDVSIRNMDEQHRDFLLMQRDRKSTVDVATVAVVTGDGLMNLFADLGAAAIVPGGQTMNPSTMDILQSVEAVPANNVIVLPNNKNIMLTAEQAMSLTSKTVKVVPAVTIPQGVSALVAFSPESDFETNIDLMTEAISVVKTIEVTRATRAARLDGLNIKQGQAIGLLDGKLSTANDDPAAVVYELLSRIDLGQAEIITIYYGAGTDEAEAEQVATSISQQYPDVEVEVVNGGQPHYNYIVSVE